MSTRPRTPEKLHHDSWKPRPPRSRRGKHRQPVFRLIATHAHMPNIAHRRPKCKRDSDSRAKIVPAYHRPFQRSNCHDQRWDLEHHYCPASPADTCRVGHQFGQGRIHDRVATETSGWRPPPGCDLYHRWRPATVAADNTHTLRASVPPDGASRVTDDAPADGTVSRLTAVRQPPPAGSTTQGCQMRQHGTRRRGPVLGMCRGTSAVGRSYQRLHPSEVKKWD